MAQESTLQAVCEDYAVSKYASSQDARLAMLQEIATLREAARDVVEAYEVAADAAEFARLCDGLIERLRKAARVPA